MSEACIRIAMLRGIARPLNTRALTEDCWMAHHLAALMGDRMVAVLQVTNTG
jgi:hypothetical protein